MEASQPNHPVRWAVAAAGLIGAAGVAAAAAAAHGAEARLLSAASTICLVNAPALLVLGLAGRRLRLGTLCAALLTLGTVLFAGDLVLRAFLGRGLFPMAAPTGGFSMIVAWLSIALGALLPSRGQE
ncbi:MAG: DUF423 domain-containing protein [Hyphomicrobiaceae bacterium]|nr:DUF423 domain-containing protein [Hyphomicrobiaceae bacterium]